MDTSTLLAFRNELYQCFSGRADSMMTLNDALLSNPSAQSFPELTLSTLFDRNWQSAYAAIEDGKIDNEALRKVRTKYAPKSLPGKRLLIAGDASSIHRPESSTMEDRTYVHVSNQPQGGKAATPGVQYSCLMAVLEEPSSWNYALDVERIPSSKTAVKVIAEQLAKTVPLLSERPLFLGDGGYGNVAFLIASEGIECDKLLRLAKNRTLYRPVPPRPENPGPGHPRKDGDKFECKDASTHGEPSESWESVPEKDQKIKVERWDHLHFREARDIEVSLIRITRSGVEDTKRNPSVFWLLFRGKECPKLSEIGRVYGCRYHIEHGFRFKKQDLMWDLPRFQSTDRFSLWTQLVFSVENQIFLARESGLAQLQKWESADRPLTPQKVRRGMGRILRELGTPARPCQVRGYSSGWQKGVKRAKLPRYKTIYKGKKTTPILKN